MKKPPRSNIPNLSPRETEILKWTACGKTSEDIADILGLSTQTVRHHLKSVARKLGATNRPHAIAIALVYGVIPLTRPGQRAIPLTTLFGLISR